MVEDMLVEMYRITRTVLYTPEQNGVAERANSTTCRCRAEQEILAPKLIRVYGYMGKH
jgi:hypothetical protein